MMKFASERQRSAHRRREALILTVACISALGCIRPVLSLIINPRINALISRSGIAGQRPILPTRSSPMRTDTKLQNKHDNNSDDDFASFTEYRDDEDGQRLAREFYQELELRQSGSQAAPTSEDTKDETAYTVRVRSSGTTPKIDGDSNAAGKNKIRTVRIKANTSGNPSQSTSGNGRQRFTNQQSKASTPQDSPIFSLFPFFSAPAPRPATSAGLFSGSGTTVYSSGRSIRAEIEILETTIKNNEAKNNKQEIWDGIYVGSPEQLEEVARIVAFSLIVLSAAYVAVEVSGGLEVISWDGAAASANHVLSLMNDATKDGMSTIMVSVSNGEVFLGEEAAWLMRESSDLAASVVEAVKSVEELVLS